MTLVFAVLFMMFVTSCGSDSKTEDKLPDTEVTDEDISDEDPTIDPTDEPTNPTDEPTNPTDEPTNPTDEPTNPTDEPTNPTDEPTNPTDEPTNPTDEPTNPTDEPTNPTDEPTNPTDEPTNPTDPTDPVETGSCSYIPNSFLSKWDDNQTPTGWVIKTDVTSEKVAHDDGYALHVTKSGPTSNFYAFETPKFETEADAALPTKITFDLATNQISKISLNIRCGAGENNDDFLVYNWVEGAFIHNQTNNAYNPVNLGDTDFHNVELTIGEEFTKEFWQNQKCRIEFKYGKNADFDVKVDNFVIHTATGACEQEDDPIEENDNDVIPDSEQPDTEEPDSEQPDTEEPDNEQPDSEEPDSEQPDSEEPDQDSEEPDSDTPEPSVCNAIPNGDFSGTWSEAGIPEGWEKQGTSVTFSNVENALKIESNYTGNQKIAQTVKFITAENAEIPAGIRFKMAAPKESSISVNLFWGEGGNDYYAYNWSPSSSAFIYAGNSTPRQHDFETKINFGDTSDPQMHDVVIIFGSEIKEKWQNNANLQIAFRAGKNVDSAIIVDDFELVYYGGTCNNVTNTYTVGWAHTQWPSSVEGYEGLSDTFYGRVYIEGLTDQTVNKSVALMGVKAQFSYRAKGSDSEITDEFWRDAEVNIAENNDFGNNDEYVIKNFSFPFEGEFEYMFRFSADNGRTWTIADNYGIAKILLPEAKQIPNGDFKYWSADGKTPQLWIVANTVTVSKWDRGENNYAAKVTANSSLSAKDIFTSGEFVVPDGKKATEITFDMATDQAIKPKIGINCASTKWYGWDSANGYFSASKSSFVSIDFGDNNQLHQTSVQLDSTTTTGTCKFIVRYTANADSWAAFDNFTVVYEDAE